MIFQAETFNFYRTAYNLENHLSRTVFDIQKSLSPLNMLAPFLATPLIVKSCALAFDLAARDDG